MCGRYVTITKVKEIEKRFGATASKDFSIVPSANVAPGQFGTVITDSKPNKLQSFQFGFTPFWAKKRMYVINARSEGDHNAENNIHYTGPMGILSKPMFRASIRKKRCLVIADAFIEGPEKEKLNKPYCVYLDDRPFAFAGIWDEWADPNTGEIIPSFSIITTQPNEATQAIGHHRSPVILAPEEEKQWINPDAELSEVLAMLRPWSLGGINAYPISPAIKDPRKSDLNLLKPLGTPVIPEYEYVLYEDLKLEGMGAAPSRQRRLFED